MPKKRENMSLTSLDDIFATDEGRLEDSQERVQVVPLSKLHTPKNHPYKVKMDEKMERLVESIREYGVLTPGIARPDGNGEYELISGNRRQYGSELAGKVDMPVIVRDMGDDEATILMVDSNLQREELLPSEKAYAYRLKRDAIQRIKGRPRKGGQVVPNYLGKKTTEIIAEESSESYKTIQRYIRLTELIPELMDCVDEKKIAFNPAVELSYLKKEEQTQLLDAMEYAQATPSLSQAQRLKKLSQVGHCTYEAMCAIMDEEKKGELDKVTIKNDVLKKYFPKSYTPKQMENTIVQLLEQWAQKRQRSKEIQK